VELLDELLLLVGEFDSHKVEYALCGGLAVGIHGIVRATIDIDLLILDTSLEDAKVSASAAGFEFETGWIPIPDPHAPRVYRLLKIVGSEYLILDLMLVNDDLQEIWMDRIDSVVAGKPISVVSKAGLIRMKSKSNRAKDLLDVENLRELDGGDQ
jgi:hypothetical protein